MTRYRFRDFCLDPLKMTLRQNGEVVSVEPQVYALIALLVENHNRTVTKEEIRQHVWSGRIVADSTFNSRIRSVRKVLGTNRDGDSLVKTIPHIGYSFTGEVFFDDEEAIEATPTPQVIAPQKVRKWRKLYWALPVLAAVTLLAAGLFRTPEYQASNGSEPLVRANSFELTPAFQSYLRGKALEEKHSEESLLLALEQYEAAILEDPKLGLAHAGKAHAMFKLYSEQDLQDPSLRDHMYASLNRALELEPDSAEVLMSAAEIAFFHKRLQEALSYTNQVIQLTPNDPRALTSKAQILEYLGQTDEALEAYRQALAIDPLSANILNDLSRAQQRQGDINEAYATAMLNVKWNPESPDALDMASHLAWNNADYAEAHRLLTAALSINSETDFAITDLIFMYDDIGMGEEAGKIARSEVDRAFVAAINGDRQPGQHILNSKPERTHDLEHLSYLVEDFESASRIRKTAFHSLAAADAMFIQPGHGFWFVEACFVFRQVDDPIAESVCAAVLDFYQNYSAERYVHATDLLGGMGWQLMNGDEQQALAWLDTLIERNHAFVNLTQQPLYASLRINPDYLPRLERMRENAADHRAAIKKLIHNDNRSLASQPLEPDGR